MFGQSLWGKCPVVYLCRHLNKHLRHFVEQGSMIIMRSNRPLSRIWTACHKNSIWLASKSFLIDVTNILLLRAIVLKNKTKILFVPFVRHIELQNFLIAPRILAHCGSLIPCVISQFSYLSCFCCCQCGQSIVQKPCRRFPEILTNF